MIKGDYHTHTAYSHGTGSVVDNVRAAVAIGLQQIAITDHGFGHLLYNIRKSDFKYFLADVAAAREEYPQIKIYAGIEANFVSAEGDIDVGEKAMDRLDIALCGYHKLASDGFFSLAGFTLPRLMFGRNSAKTVVATTEAYIRAIANNRIDIISHPNRSAKIDVLAVGEAAKELGVLLELNGKRIDMTDEQIIKLAEMGCQFIIGSDAHSPDRVGDFSLPLAAVERIGLPVSCIANWDRLPVFGRRQSE